MPRLLALVVAFFALVVSASFAQNAYFATLATISPTTTLSPGHICVAATNGKDIYCDATLPSATGGLGVSTFASLTDVSVSVAAGNMIAVGALPSYSVSNSTAFGLGALSSSSNSGQWNTAFGRLSLSNNTSGYYNTSVGGNTLANNTTGYQNNAHGVAALAANTSGVSNNAYGVQALQNNSTGSFNAAFGNAAMAANTTGSANTALGTNSGGGVTTGTSNTLLGYFSGSNLTTGNNNIIIGYGAQAQTNTDSNTLNIGGAIYGTGLGSSPKVGIGTATPFTTLQVSGKANVGVGTQVGFASPNAQLQLETNSGTANSLVIWQAGVAAAELGSKAGDTNFYLTNTYYGSGLGSVLGTVTSSIVIDKNGTVGIGTATPDSSLTVVGEAKANSVHIAALAGAPDASKCVNTSDQGRIVVGSDGREFLCVFR